MRTIKSKKAELESKRFIFLQIGFIIALSAALVAFEWKSLDSGVMEFDARMADNFMEEVVAITKHEEIKPPEPKPKVTTVLNIVDDTEDPIDDIVIDVGDDQFTEMKTYEFKLEDEDEKGSDEDKIFIVVEDEPSFPGGYMEMQRYLSQNIKYPQMARESNIVGTVYISFVVAKDGSITKVKIERGIGGGCDEEAFRVVKNMPRWEPGKQRGKAVNVMFNLPVSFKLR